MPLLHVVTACGLLTASEAEGAAMGSRHSRRFESYLPWEGNLEEFDLRYCRGRILAGSIEANSTTLCGIDMEATDRSMIGSYAYFSTPWTVLSATDEEGARMLDEAKAVLAPTMKPAVFARGRPKMPAGPLGRRSLLLRGATETKIVSYDRPASLNTFIARKEEQAPVAEEEGRRGYFGLSPEMLMPHQKAILFEIDQFEHGFKSAPGAEA